MRNLLVLVVVLVCQVEVVRADPVPVTVLFFDDFRVEDGGDVIINLQDGSQPAGFFSPGTVQELANGTRYFLFTHKAFPNFVGTAVDGWKLIRIGRGDYLPGSIALPRPAAAVPEPSTLTLLGLGLAGLAGNRKLNRRQWRSACRASVKGMVKKLRGCRSLWYGAV